MKHLYEYNYDMPETSGIYEIVNNINGHRYIGQAQHLPSRAILLDHEHNTPLMSAYEKYGVENFSINLLEECTVDQLDDREIYWIAKLHTYVHDPESVGYNLTTGGSGMRGYVFTEEDKQKIRERLKDTHPWLGREHSEETKKKISDSRKLYVGENHPLYGKHRTEETKRKIHDALIGREMTEIQKQHMRDSSPHLSGKDHPMYGKHHTEETKEKMSKSHKEYYTEEIRSQLSEKYTGEGNPFYGKKHSEETIQKIKDHMPDFSGENNPMYGKHLSDDARKKLSESHREGYASGRVKKLYGDDNPSKRPEVREKLRETMSKKIWVNNGVTMRMINNDESIPKGYVRGRLPGCTKRK